MKIGLFFGSFNPVHTGHMIIANYLLQYSDMKEVWMVVSPQNPFKLKSTLASDYIRLDMAHLAIGDQKGIRASNVEFNLTQPSYTVDTLTHLSERYPDKTFSLIMGGDNLQSFHKWKNYEVILASYHIYVYSRPGYSNQQLINHPHVHILESPMLDISASLIRKMISEGKDVRYLVPDAVYEYLNTNNLYKT